MNTCTNLLILLLFAATGCQSANSVGAHDGSSSGGEVQGFQGVAHQRREFTLTARRPEVIVDGTTIRLVAVTDDGTVKLELDLGQFQAAQMGDAVLTSKFGTRGLVVDAASPAEQMVRLVRTSATTWPRK